MNNAYLYRGHTPSRISSYKDHFKPYQSDIDIYGIEKKIRSVCLKSSKIRGRFKVDIWRLVLILQVGNRERGM